MVKQVQGAGGSKPVNRAAKADEVKTAKKTAKNNVPMQKKKTEAYIETESYLQNCKYRWYGFTGNHGPKATKEENEKYAKWQKMNYAVNNTDYIINDDGSVRFVFKNKVNVQDFKEAFGMNEPIRAMQLYLEKRHNEGVKNGSVKAVSGVGDNSEERIANYNAMSEDAEVSFNDGMIMTKKRKGLFNVLSPHHDYRKMTLGPADNDKLFTFGASFFDPYKD